MTKGTECRYPPTPPKSTHPRHQHSDVPLVEQTSAVPSLVENLSNVDNRQEASSYSDLLNNSLLRPDPDLANIGMDLDWNELDINFADVLDPPTNKGTIESPSSRSSPLVRYSTTSSNQTVPLQHAFPSPHLSIPPQPTNSLRSLIQRPKLGSVAQRTSSLILHTLKSYPLMMLRHNTLPPFIHPQPALSDVDDNYMEPLSNCISLVHMISSGVQGSRKLFWKNVRMECERLGEEVCQVCNNSRMRITRS